MLKKQEILKFLDSGVHIFSSGTTGYQKKIFRSPKNLAICIKTALKEQEITSVSSILTVTKLEHAGGLLAQTLPALSIGANVEICSFFKPKSFLESFKNHSHTFLPPRYIEVLKKTKEFSSYDFQQKRILTGSDPVSWELIEALIHQNAVVQTNWGMSEIGPIVIHSTFSSIKEVEVLKKKTPKGSTLLGDQISTDYKIEGGELLVKSSQCVYKGWFATGDLVQSIDGVLFYQGRKNVCN